MQALTELLRAVLMELLRALLTELLNSRITTRTASQTNSKINLARILMVTIHMETILTEVLTTGAQLLSNFILNP